MKKAIGFCMGAALLVAAPVARAQEPPAAKQAEAEKAPGKRLHVRFQETRQRGESATPARPSVLVLHADGKPARVFLGTQVTLTTSDKTAPATLFKNAGVEAEVTATTLADGRYRLDVKFEEGGVLTGDEGAPPGDNPILRIVRGKSRLVLREGETVPFVSAVDPVTGEVVHVDVTVSAAPLPKAAAGAGSEGARLRAQVLLTRRQGERTVARRPYAIVLQASGEEAADVFSGSELPVQLAVQGQPTVMLKDVGAGLRITARRATDGRYRLDLSFSDGTISMGPRSPAVRAFECESQLFLQEGETVTIASAVDPRTGEVVEAELTLEGVR
ncbi:MAG TPA: hypothetical protein VL691_00040 [Vicinamibacteria bacterium]|nr:hypothetical protein [Vicinamibacteria bacterium]